jgi:ER membrane protein complex subunit 7
MRLTNLITPSSISILLLLLLPALIQALSIPLTISLVPTSHLPNPGALPPSTTASLTTLSNTYTAHLSSLHAFNFRNLSAPGSYLFSISSATHSFAPLRVDVDEEGSVRAWRTFRGHEWDNRGEELAVKIVDGKRVLEAKAVGKKEYYMERQGCKSPLLTLFLLKFSPLL